MDIEAAIPATEERRFEKVCQILQRYHYDKSKLIPILQAVQDEYRYLPETVLTYVASSLDIPPAQVYGVATFYAHFALQPKGEYVIRLCDGTACHVRGSHGILEALYKRLDLDSKRNTTDDMMFTVETVSCLGACGLAPVMVINDKVYGQVTPERAVEIVEELMTKESAE